MHIISQFWSDDFSQSYGPLKFYINCTYSAILVRAISQQLMTGIQWNFMGSFTTKRRCAYYQPVLVGWFFTELWPFEIFHCTYSAILVRAISQQLMTGIQWNFMGSFTTKRRCAYYQPVLVGWFFTELWPFEIFHCTYSAILVRAISQQLITYSGNSMKLYGKLHYQQEMYILSAGYGRMLFHRVMALWNFL